jgi:hypothetical protein
MAQISCPKCTCIATESRGCLIWLGVILLFPIGLVLLLLKPPYYKCMGCGFKFKP